MKEEDRLRAELAETKAKLKDAESRLNQLAGEMRGRLDQLTSGRRSEFETALLAGLRKVTVNSETSPCYFVFQDNPALTKYHAESICYYINLLAHDLTKSSDFRELYTKMRDAFIVMLEHLPPPEDAYMKLKPPEAPKR